MEVTAKSLLTSDFFRHFALLYQNDSEEDMYEFFDGFKSQLALYVSITYGDLAFWDDLGLVESSAMAYAVLSDTFKRLYGALTAEYNPLENYYVDRTMSTDTDGDVKKTGNKETTPTGTIEVNSNGTKTHGYQDDSSVSQGTTFESYGDNDFKNINRVKHNGTVTDGFNNFGTTTSYQNYKTTETYNNINTNTDMTESIEEHRAGNSGIFRKQELTTAEIDLRVKNQLVKIFCRMLVDLFNKGVW